MDRKPQQAYKIVLSEELAKRVQDVMDQMEIRKSKDFFVIALRMILNPVLENVAKEEMMTRADAFARAVSLLEAFYRYRNTGKKLCFFDPKNQSVTELVF